MFNSSTAVETFEQFVFRIESSIAANEFLSVDTAAS